MSLSDRPLRMHLLLFSSTLATHMAGVYTGNLVFLQVEVLPASAALGMFWTYMVPIEPVECLFRIGGIEGGTGSTRRHVMYS